MRKRQNKPSKLIKQIAAQHGDSVDEVVRDLLAAIDAAWDNPDPAARAKQRQLFPGGKPTVEEFINVTARDAKKRLDI